MDGQASTFAVTPQDIIFSCCICGDTLAEIYDHKDRRVGLHHEPTQRYGRIVKIYLTGCAHVVCAKHLEGGGAPFHPSNQLPKAVCPFCQQNKNDNTLQVLFGINGTGASDHDANIPQTYFDTPPAGLIVDGENMDALRFQYLSILRYATLTSHKHVLAKNKLAEERAARQEEERKQRAEQAERTRKMHLLGKIVTATQGQLKRARDWLYNLGQDVSSIDDSMSYQHILDDPLLLNYEDVDAVDEASIISGDNVDARLEQQRTAASTQRHQGRLQLARGSAADLETMTRYRRIEAPSTASQQYQQPLDAVHTHAPAVLHQQSSSNLTSYAPALDVQPLNRPPTQTQDYYATLKRKRVTDDAGRSPQRIASRDAMPPPPFPAQRFTPASLNFGPQTAFRSGPIQYHNAATRARTSSQSPATLTGHDGELDNMGFHQPTPQRPIYRPNSGSPFRDRLTLTPRMATPSRGAATGLLSHARSSSAAASGSHRQQLGQSPYFGMRKRARR